MNHICDCGNKIAMPHVVGYGEIMIGVSCNKCPVYWDLVADPNVLYKRAVRWQCPVCGSSAQKCKNAPPISKCYRGPDMMTAHLDDKATETSER